MVMCQKDNESKWYEKSMENPCVDLKFPRGDMMCQCVQLHYHGEALMVLEASLQKWCCGLVRMTGRG